MTQAFKWVYGKPALAKDLCVPASQAFVGISPSLFRKEESNEALDRVSNSIFHAVVPLLQVQGERIPVLFADTLQRFNYMAFARASPGKALRRAQEDAVPVLESLRRCAFAFETGTLGFDVISWEEPANLHSLRKYVADTPQLSQLIDDAAVAFFHWRAKGIGIRLSPQRLEHVRGYIIEEMPSMIEGWRGRTQILHPVPDVQLVESPARRCVESVMHAAFQDPALRQLMGWKNAAVTYDVVCRHL